MSLGLIGDSIPKVWAAPFLIDLVTPKQWKTIPTKSLTETGYTVYGANGIIGYYNTYTHEEPTLMITCRGATCGNLHISKAFSYINGNAMALDNRPSEHISLNFLNYALKARGLEDTISGSAQPQITRQGLTDVKIPLPPLAEQKVIADKLDTLLAQVESTKSRLERIPDILKRFRQSVLSSAVSGKLTEDWREENEIQKLKINDVCENAFDGPFGSKLKTSDYTSEGARVARLENIGHLNFIYDKQTYISLKKLDELKRNQLKLNDLLFSSFVDEEVRVCVFRIKDEPFINKADCFCLRPNRNVVDSDYLSYTLASLNSFKQIKSQVQGVTRPRINLKILKSLEFDFPPLPEQQEIVQRVEKLFAYADRIESQAQAALDRVNKLTQSILAKAFRGELTADWRAANPDLISGENSAQALLEKIQSERASQKPVKKTKRKK